MGVFIGVSLNAEKDVLLWDGNGLYLMACSSRRYSILDINGRGQ